jgi:hypothetical protein
MKNKMKLKLKTPQVFYDVESGDLSDSPYTWYTTDELVNGADVVHFSSAKEMMKVLFANDIQLALNMSHYYPNVIEVK